MGDTYLIAMANLYHITVKCMYPFALKYILLRLKIPNILPLNASPCSEKYQLNWDKVYILSSVK